MKTVEQMMIKNAVQGVYDVQKLRIASGQRILAQLLMKLGLPNEPPPAAENETKEQEVERKNIKEERDRIINDFLEKLGITPADQTPSETTKRKKPVDFFSIILQDYKGITDYITKEHASVKRAVDEASIGIISHQSEMEILDAYFMLEKSEEKLLKPVKRLVEEHPLWINFLSEVKGVGPLMAGVLLSELDIYKADYISSFWKYAGLDVVLSPLKDGNGDTLLDDDGIPEMVGQGRSRKKEHQIKVSYTDKNGAEQERDSLTYNPFLKTKLIGVLGTSFLRSGGYYPEIYYNYKNRLQMMPEHKDKSKIHIHNMAIRYMIKYFLADLYVAWCLTIGITPPTPYHVGVLGMHPHHTTSPALIPLLEKKAPHLITG